jgi:MFS superfamily sulfate permease-like transporter
LSSPSPNRELVALGAGNIGASLVSGTVPGYGSITRGRLAAGAGARTQLASLLTGVFIFLSTFFLLRFLYYLPTAILGAIIFVVVYSILVEAPKDIRFFIRMRAWGDLALMAITFILTISWSVQVCAFLPWQTLSRETILIYV